MFQGLANRGLATNISFHGLGFGNQHFRLGQFKALRFGNHFSWRPRPSRQNLCLSKRGLVWLKLGAMFFYHSDFLAFLFPSVLPCLLPAPQQQRTVAAVVVVVVVETTTVEPPELNLRQT